MVQLNLNLTVTHVCTNVAQYISNNTCNLLLSAHYYFLQYVPHKDNMACQVLSSTVAPHKHWIERVYLLSCTWVFSVLVPPSSIQESLFFNTQHILKVPSYMLVIKKLYSIILFSLRASYLCNYILGVNSTFGSFILGRYNTCWQFS